MPLKSGAGVDAAHKFIRKNSKHISKDGILNLEIENMHKIIFDDNFLPAVEKVTGKL